MSFENWNIEELFARCTDYDDGSLSMDKEEFSALRRMLQDKAEPEFPENLPCPVVLEPGLRFGKGVPTKTMLGALHRRAEYYAELDAMTPEQRAEHDAGIKAFSDMIHGGNKSELLSRAEKISRDAESLAESIQGKADGNSPVIQDGWVMVPVEPTAEMYDAGDRQLATKQVWDAMIAAAPLQEADNV